MNMIPEKYKNTITLKVTDIQDILGISRSAAYKFAQEGLFPKIKVGHTVRIPTVRFFEWLSITNN